LNLVPLDAAAARKIPLGRLTEDTWALSSEHHGNYTVKSGYRVLVVVEAQQRACQQRRVMHSNNLNDFLWKNLSKCTISPKVRVFWWSLLHNFMPSGANLHQKHIDQLSTYVTCAACDETTFHALPLRENLK
jgi:hypothetical protein